MKLSLMKISAVSWYRLPLWSDIPSIILFSNTLSPCYTLRVEHQVYINKLCSIYSYIIVRSPPVFIISA
jgi:hypothetical protein